LSLDDDILLAAKDRARHSGVSVGAVVSDLARRGLRVGATGAVEAERGEEFMGFRPRAPRGAVVTNTIVNAIREADGI
jgi:hypothetical protein